MSFVIHSRCLSVSHTCVALMSWLLDKPQNLGTEPCLMKALGLSASPWVGEEAWTCNGQWPKR